jgi:hypothetical protein
MIGWSTEGSQAALTASHTLRAKSGDESEKVSGENSYDHSVPAVDGSSFVIERAYFVHSTARATVSSSFMLNTIC